MERLQDFLDDPPFGLMIAAALGLVVTVFAVVGFQNLRGGDEVDTGSLSTTTQVTESSIAPASPNSLVFTPATSDGLSLIHI